MTVPTEPIQLRAAARRAAAARRGAVNRTDDAGARVQLALPLPSRQEGDRCDRFGCGDVYPFGRPDRSHLMPEQRSEAEEMGRLVHAFAHDLNESDEGFMLSWSVPLRLSQPKRMK